MFNFLDVFLSSDSHEGRVLKLRERKIRRVSGTKDDGEWPRLPIFFLFLLFLITCSNFLSFFLC